MFKSQFEPPEFTRDVQDCLQKELFQYLLPKMAWHNGLFSRAGSLNASRGACNIITSRFQQSMGRKGAGTFNHLSSSTGGLAPHHHVPLPI